MSDDLLGPAPEPEGEGFNPAEGLEVIRGAFRGIEQWDRLTFNQTLHHEHVGDQPVSVQNHYWRWLKDQEQPYQRRTTVGERWTPLDLGWIGETAGFLAVENRSGKHLKVNPTEQERAQFERQVLELGLATPTTVLPFARVPAGALLALEPVDAAALRIRCRAGQAPVTITVISF